MVPAQKEWVLTAWALMEWDRMALPQTVWVRKESVLA
jgi:hypothetical protein